MVSLYLPVFACGSRRCDPGGAAGTARRRSRHGLAGAGRGQHAPGLGVQALGRWPERPTAAASSSGVVGRRAPQEIRQPRGQLEAGQPAAAGVGRDRARRSRCGRGSSATAGSAAITGASAWRRIRGRRPAGRPAPGSGPARPRSAGGARPAGRTRATNVRAQASSTLPDGQVEEALAEPGVGQRLAGQSRRRPAPNFSTPWADRPHARRAHRGRPRDQGVRLQLGGSGSSTVGPSRSRRVLWYWATVSRRRPPGPGTNRGGGSSGSTAPWSIQRSMRAISSSGSGVALDRHAVLAALAAQPPHQVAGSALPGTSRSSLMPPLASAAGADQLQARAGLLRAVAGDAGALEDGQDLRLEVDRRRGRGRRTGGEQQAAARVAPGASTAAHLISTRWTCLVEDENVFSQVYAPVTW